jgi:dihydroneopterin aldolase
MQGIIHVQDIKLYGYHGCLDEEACIGSDYIVDVIIRTDYSEAAKKDDLTQTVDYCNVYGIVKREMKIRSKLIENVAMRIASALKNELARIGKVSVTVTKINPPVNGDVGSVSVIAES